MICPSKRNRSWSVPGNNFFIRDNRMKSIKHINEEGNLWFKQTQIGIPKSTDLLAGCRACGMSFDFKFPSLYPAPAASSARSVLADAVEPFMEQMLKSLVFSSDFYPYYVLNTTGHVTTDKKIAKPMAKFLGEL